MNSEEAQRVIFEWVRDRANEHEFSNPMGTLVTTVLRLADPTDAEASRLLEAIMAKRREGAS